MKSFKEYIKKALREDDLKDVAVSGSLIKKATKKMKKINKDSNNSSRDND